MTREILMRNTAGYWDYPLSGQKVTGITNWAWSAAIRLPVGLGTDMTDTVVWTIFRSRRLLTSTVVLYTTLHLRKSVVSRVGKLKFGYDVKDQLGVRGVNRLWYRANMAAIASFPYLEFIIT